MQNKEREREGGRVKRGRGRDRGRKRGREKGGREGEEERRRERGPSATPGTSLLICSHSIHSLTSAATSGWRKTTTQGVR